MAAATSTPTRTAMNAKNSVVLNAALVSVLIRRVRCGALRAPLAVRSVRISSVRVLMKSSGLVSLRVLGLSAGVECDHRAPPEEWGDAVGPWFRRAGVSLPGA